MTEKDRKKTAGRPETVAPKPFVYGLFLFLARIIFKLLYRIRFVRDPRIAKTKGPIFIVGNHTSYPDPLYCALALPDRRIRFVSGQEVVDTKLLRPIVKHFSIIEIKPFRVNFSTTKEIITSIADGHSVALYPETQRSIAGGLTPFGLATAKLIKHLKVPVAAVVCRGSYLGWPRWGKGLQPGQAFPRKYRYRYRHLQTYRERASTWHQRHQNLSVEPSPRAFGLGYTYKHLILTLNTKM